MFSRFQVTFLFELLTWKQAGLGGLEFENPGAVFELIARVEVGVIGSAGLPHFPEDFEPALAEAAQGAGVTLPTLSKVVIIGGRPGTGGSTQIGPEVDGVAQGLVAVTPEVHLVDLAGLITDRSRSGQALEAAGILEAGAIGADLAQ